MLKTIYWKLLLFFLRYLNLFIKDEGLKNKIAKKQYEGMRYKLSKQNVELGENSIVYNTKFSFSSKGDRFYIGSNTTITGATLLGHDASPCVFLNDLVTKSNVWAVGSRKSFRDPINVGNNVFIGHGCIVLPGVTIGDNTIVAAGSVVTKNLESNSVYAGNPARKVKDIHSYIEKYKSILSEFPEKF